VHFLLQPCRERRATDTEQAHDVAPADPTQVSHGPLLAIF
jgi:hypothetical protein